MTILETDEFTLIQRSNVIFDNVNRSSSSLPIGLMYQMLDTCDDIAREFFPRDIEHLVIDVRTLTYRIGQVINRITVQTTDSDDIIHHIIQVSNQLASILFLTGINNSRNNQIILNRTNIYKDIIRGFNAIQDFQRNTSITQVAGLTKKALGTFG